jgi:kumamolisin
MDLEILAALAPAAHLVVYFASGDEQGLYHALNRAVHDEQHRPGILSVSWSLPEHTLSASELHAIEGVLQEAAHLGITVCASSGDAGALNGSTDGKPSVNYPASSPHCLACGGTSGKVDGAGIPEEVVWNASHYGFKGASGGGVSQRFHVPAWQNDADVPAGPEGRGGRGVPDVAGLADPRHGCEMLIAGRAFASAGTSAVAPMWAALIARLNQALGDRCGHLHPHLYWLGKKGGAALRPVLKGDNGLYRAGKGWNACTGYGTPKGDGLLAHLRKEFVSRKRAEPAAHAGNDSKVRKHQVSLRT